MTPREGARARLPQPHMRSRHSQDQAVGMEVSGGNAESRVNPWRSAHESVIGVPDADFVLAARAREPGIQNHGQRLTVPREEKRATVAILQRTALGEQAARVGFPPFATSGCQTVAVCPEPRGGLASPKTPTPPPPVEGVGGRMILFVSRRVWYKPNVAGSP